MATREEIIVSVFEKYMDSLRTKSLRWTIRGDTKRGDKRIERYLKYFCLPIKEDEVIALLDTTVFRTGKEGYLFTTSGIVVKEVVEKLYYLDYSKIARAEFLEETDEYYNVTTSVWIHFKDGTKRKIFDYYLKKYFFVEYINEVIEKSGAIND